MRYLSVCSGIEAASIAWEPLGWEAAAFAEIEPFPSAVLNHYWPGVPNLGDFTKIKTEDIGPIDVLVGGTPCQAFSIAGLRGGLDDDRGNLALEFLRLADRTRPRWVVFENVPGILSSTSHAAPDPCPPPPPLDLGCDGAEVDTEDEYDSEELHAFNCFLAGLSEIGYGFAYRVFDAQFFGLAQRRERVFVVGYLGDWRPPVAVLIERESLQGHPAPSREARKDIAPTISARTSAGGGLGTDFDLDGGLVANVAVADGGGLCLQGMRRDECDSMVADMRVVRGGTGDIAHTLRGDGFDAGEDGTGRGERAVSENPDAGPDGIGVREGDAFTLEARSQVQAIAFGGGNTSGDIDVAPALNAGATKRLDFDSETLIAFDCKAGANTGFACGDIPGALRGEGFGGGHNAIAFSCKDHGADASNDIAPTLRAMSFDRIHANAGGQVAIAFSGMAQGGGGWAPPPCPSSEELALPLDCTRAQAVAVSLRSREGGATAELSGDVMPALRCGGGGGDKPHALGSFGVRRLTPRECERLQGFPDCYTKIPWRGKPAEACPDGPRYKAIGNSMAVPVMAWIGRRIAMVEEVLKIRDGGNQWHKDQ